MPSLVMAFGFPYEILIRILQASHSTRFREELDSLGIASGEIHSRIAFVQKVAQALDRNRVSNVPDALHQLASLALRRTLTEFFVKRTESLFGSGLQDVQAICRELTSEKTFGQLARAYFASSLSRLVKFVADKETSNYVGPEYVLSSPAKVLEFEQDLNRFCWESARIVEDFATGWYSKQTWQGGGRIPPGAAIRFTAVALRKLQSQIDEVHR